MKFYLKDSDIPELKGFDRSTQNWLKALAGEQLRRKKRFVPWIPVTVGVFGVAIGAFLSLIIAALLWPALAEMPFEDRWFLNCIACAPGAVLVGWVAGFFGKQILNVHLRPHLRRLVETHRSEERC